MKHGRGSVVLIYAVLAVLLLACIVVCPALGPVKISLAKAWGLAPDGAGSVDARIFWSARVPRVAFALVAGAALALAGASYQVVLRNALADPYTLGVSGGSALGALLALRLGGVYAGPWLLPSAALAGAVMAVGFILALSRVRGPSVAPLTMLLAGVTVNALTGAGVMLVQYLSKPYETFAMIRWMMGGVDVQSLQPVCVLLGVLVVCGGWLVARAGVLNVLALGYRTAAHLGVAVDRERLWALMAASALASVTVAYAGPIGFVGLLVPHGMRLVVGPDHRVLLPSVAAAGAVVLCLADTAARTVLAPSEVPVGIVTALLGGPCFLVMLCKRH